MTSPDTLPKKVAQEDAALRVVSLEGLLEGRQSSMDDLLKACTDLGFFYLDCRDVASGQVMKNVKDMYELGKSFFDLSQEEKSEWLVDRDHDEHLVMGYKPAGHGNGPVENVKDGFEGLMVRHHIPQRHVVQFPGVLLLMKESFSNIPFPRSATLPLFQGPK